MPSSCDWIRVRGAREHNLQNIDVDLPHGGLSVLTGPSGSGKSSLAFDTLYAEGQRRYLETLRGNSRALFDQLQRPDVDLIDGLPPTLCVAQHLGTPQPRSTLSTLTDLHDHLRLLWARAGTVHCHRCQSPIARTTLTEIARATLARPEGQKILILAPLVREQPGDHRGIFEEMRKLGFLRVRVDGVLLELQLPPKLKPGVPHTVELVVDRLVVRPGIDDRLHDSLEAAVKHSGGPLIITEAEDGDWHDTPYSTRYACPRCDIIYPELQPRVFSFNSPYGACPHCGGLGRLAVAAADGEAAPAWEEAAVCPECEGTRLRLEARAVRFEGKGIHEVVALSVAEAERWFQCLPSGGDKVRAVLLRELTDRLGFLRQVGLGYLTLDRPVPTLSGGEIQRARLATHLGAGLLGVCYILDEPTVGLHPRDTDRLLDALRGLQARGNTVIVVEHDEAVIRAADYVVEMGPGAGKAGGKILWSGPAGTRSAPPPTETAAPAPVAPATAEVVIRDARLHNLKGFDARFPVGRLTCVSGVSGSGKSSLVRGILRPAARRQLGLKSPPPGPHGVVVGLEAFDKLIEVDQSALGRGTRSSPATYTGLFDEIRGVFARVKEAKLRGYKANRFSFNVKGGRCEECQGQGVLRIAMQLLPDLETPCPVCHGRRFNPATLAIRFKGLSIADVLALSARDALEIFKQVPALERILSALVDVGLGYVALGQPSSTLSGGEAQRVKLAAELAKPSTGRTLILLDEPTTGLHASDVAQLLIVLRRLVDKGNTLVVIEHNLDMLAAADWLIDLGPEGGEEGGYLLAEGPPEALKGNVKSLTGQYLLAASSSA